MDSWFKIRHSLYISHMHSVSESDTIDHVFVEMCHLCASGRVWTPV